jgi:hypothetical protein
MPFVFVVDGQKTRGDDLTLDEIVEVEKAAGTGWYALNPYNSAVHCRALLVEIYARSHSREDAQKLVGALTVRQAESMVDFVAEDDRPIEYEDGIPVVDPKAGTGEPGTT